MSSQNSWNIQLPNTPQEINLPDQTQVSSSENDLSCDIERFLQCFPSDQDYQSLSDSTYNPNFMPDLAWPHDHNPFGYPTTLDDPLQTETLTYDDLSTLTANDIQPIFEDQHLVAEGAIQAQHTEEQSERDKQDPKCLALESRMEKLEERMRSIEKSMRYVCLIR